MIGLPVVTVQGVPIMQKTTSDTGNFVDGLVTRDRADHHVIKNLLHFTSDSHAPMHDHHDHVLMHARTGIYSNTHKHVTTIEEK